MKRKCQKKGVVVLTYDDGPSKEMTPELLDLLESNQTRATFFILGNKVTDNLPIIRRMVAFGHEIGCHGYDHLNAAKTMPWTAVADIIKGVKTFSNARIHCELFRPPYGKITFFTLGVVFLESIKTVWWNFVSGDTYETLPDPDLFTDQVINEGGGVVLMHDFHTSEGKKDFVLKVTSLLIKKSRQRGLSIKTLGEVF